MADDAERFHGHVSAVSREQHGDELVTAAAIGATSLQVIDTADFDETGGQVRIGGPGGAILDYTGIDDDTATITLAAATTVTAEVADRVDVWDPDSGLAGDAVTEFVAEVIDDATGDKVQATLTHALIDRVARNVRGLVGESVVCVVDDDGIWTLTEILGKAPAIDGAYVEVDDVPLSQSLQDIYDQANANAAAAATAAYTATVAQSTADGKNTVTYSNSAPGSTANKAGDLWFQRDGSPLGGIIAQFEGLGGTSWASRLLRNEVIANLDAGKITAGTAFINALQVLTNFTLGSAAINGVIQSYNFAGSSVGVYIDKYGLVAKGGSIAGATVTGGKVEGAEVYTASPTSSAYIRITGAGTGGVGSTIECRGVGHHPQQPARVRAGSSTQLLLQSGSGTTTFTDQSQIVLSAGPNVDILGTTRVTGGPLTVGASGTPVLSFSCGDFTGNTNGSAQVTISHGMNVVPKSVSVTVKEAQGGANRHAVTVETITSTTITFVVRTGSGGLVSSTTGFYWQAWA